MYTAPHREKMARHSDPKWDCNWLSWCYSNRRQQTQLFCRGRVIMLHSCILKPQIALWTIQ